MAFAAGLRETLQLRRNQAPSEFTRGDRLEHVLDRHLLAVEQMGEGDLLTSILLLSPDGRRLTHGAAPNLPRAYCEAIDGSEIGPTAGSCGTAAHFGRPVYVTDIASDPLWADYRDLALAHGLRSCWSTPIRDNRGEVIGTFAIYHRTPGAPSRQEIEAIDLITEHVAEAIVWAQGLQDLERAASTVRCMAQLKLVSDNDEVSRDGQLPLVRLIDDTERLERLAAELEVHAEDTGSEGTAAAMRTVAENIRKLVDTIRRQVDGHAGLSNTD